MAEDPINSVKSVNSGNTGKVNWTNSSVDYKEAFAERLKKSNIFTVAANVNAHRT